MVFPRKSPRPPPTKSLAPGHAWDTRCGAPARTTQKGARTMLKLHHGAAVAACLAAGWAAPAHANAVTDWNAIAVNCISVAPPPAAQGGRGGPTQPLDLALVQAAVHDAIQAIEGRYEPYLAHPAATGGESKAAAASAAAYRVLLKV